MLFLRELLIVAASVTGAQAAGPADVDSWARTLRMQVYDTFRADRAEYDRRRTESERTIEAWRAAGERPEDVAALIDWLKRSVDASRPGSVAALPAPPRFGVDATPPPQPMALPLPADNVRVVEPAPTIEPVPTIEPAPAAPERPALPPTRTPKAVTPELSGDRVQINLIELEARVTGYNRAIRTMELELGDTRAPTAEDLARIVDELADLVRRQHALVLYREHVVSASDRENLAALSPLTDVAALVGNRIFSARQAASARSTADEAARDAELNRLDELSRRLAELAVPQP